MSTWVYPPIPAEELKKAEDESVARELQWLLGSLQDSLTALKAGLEECVALLAPREPGSTLVLSSLRSESVKGYVTRVGTKIVKGDIHLRLHTLTPNTTKSGTNQLPSTRLTIASTPEAPDLQLLQLQSVKMLINDSLDIIDVSRWTGQSTDASFISGQLKLLHEYLCDAKDYLKGPSPTTGHSSIPGGEWWTSSVESAIFLPPLPGTLSLHFTIQDANLVLTVRSLDYSPSSQSPSAHDSSFSLSGLNLRNRLLGPRLPNHDEMGEVFAWRGRHDVTVREKVRVESGDPSLMSVAAKLNALEHEVARWKLNLRILTGDLEEDD